MNNSRHERWVKASISTAKFELFMTPQIQSLGRLDIKLIDEDAEFLKDFEKNRNDLEANGLLNDRMTISYLWVLGAYEAIRTMCQRIRENQELVSPDIAELFNNLRRKFNRLRVPLAKMEAASAHKTTDSHIAYPGINLTLGIAWKVAEDTFISRRELSDDLLSVLEGGRTDQISRNNIT